MVDEAGQLPIDFKFIVFNGRTAIIRTHLDRFGDHHVNFYDADLRLLPVRQDFPTDPSYVPPPEVAAMTEVAEKLAQDFDYARIDLYLIRQQVRFGEITHYDGNAIQRFQPDDFDLHLGNLWQLEAVAGSPPSPDARWPRPTRRVIRSLGVVGDRLERTIRAKTHDRKTESRWSNRSA